eukprot:324181-Rhodomonas_salina.1
MQYRTVPFWAGGTMRRLDWSALLTRLLVAAFLAQLVLKRGEKVVDRVQWRGVSGVRTLLEALSP